MPTPAVVKSSSRTGGTDTYLTPKWILDAVREDYRIDLDTCTEPSNPVAAKYTFTEEYPEEAFSSNWSTFIDPGGIAWNNSPYGNMSSRPRRREGWGSLIERQAVFNRCRIISLLPSRTDRGWFRRLVTVAQDVVFLKERLEFLGADGLPRLDRHGKPTKAPFPSVMMSFNCPLPNAIRDAGILMDYRRTT